MCPHHVLYLEAAYLLCSQRICSAWRLWIRIMYATTLELCRSSCFFQRAGLRTGATLTCTQRRIYKRFDAYNAAGSCLVPSSNCNYSSTRARCTLHNQSTSPKVALKIQCNRHHRQSGCAELYQRTMSYNIINLKRKPHHHRLQCTPASERNYCNTLIRQHTHLTTVEY
jgi:hypothetical protein